MTYDVNSNNTERVFVNGNPVTRVVVNGAQAWPLAYTVMTAGNDDFLYGYSDTGEYGSISEDVSVKGAAIGAITKVGTGSGDFAFRVNSEVPKSFFTALVIETRDGIQRFQTSSASYQSSGTTVWTWQVSGQMFTDGINYESWVT